MDPNEHLPAANGRYDLRIWQINVILMLNKVSMAVRSFHFGG